MIDFDQYLFQSPHGAQITKQHHLNKVNQIGSVNTLTPPISSGQRKYIGSSILKRRAKKRPENKKRQKNKKDLLILTL